MLCAQARAFNLAGATRVAANDKPEGAQSRWNADTLTSTA
jgi:hypothetical protein